MVFLVAGKKGLGFRQCRMPICGSQKFLVFGAAAGVLSHLRFCIIPWGVCVPPLPIPLCPRCPLIRCQGEMNLSDFFLILSYAWVFFLLVKVGYFLKICQIIILPFLVNFFLILEISDWLTLSWADNQEPPTFKKVCQKGKNMIWRVFWKYLNFM